MTAASSPAVLHGARPCKSCPFRVNRGDSYFDPDTLDAAVGENLRGDQHVHRCHNEGGAAARQRLCVGFMRYIIANDIPNAAFRFGVRLQVINPSIFDAAVPIIEDWDDVLADHAATMLRSEGG